MEARVVRWSTMESVGNIRIKDGNAQNATTSAGKGEALGSYCERANYEDMFDQDYSDRAH